MNPNMPLNRIEFSALCALAMIGVSVVEAKKASRLEKN